MKLKPIFFLILFSLKGSQVKELSEPQMITESKKLNEFKLVNSSFNKIKFLKDICGVSSSITGLTLSVSLFFNKELKIFEKFMPALISFLSPLLAFLSMNYLIFKLILNLTLKKKE